MNAGQKIKQMRKQFGIGAEVLAENAGITKSTLYRYEKGEIEKIPMAVLEKVAKTLGCSVLAFTDLADNTPSERDVIYIPVVGRVSAGIGNLAEQYHECYESASASSISADASYIYLRVTGDSMYPVFMENDLVLVQAQNQVDSGSYAVVIIDECDGVIKKVIIEEDYIELVSINPMYPPRRFEGSDMSRIKICGLVKEIKRKF
ncbi:MAG: LexA family transcriptional regulator [Ruminococcaceae bacterium]|nr:LexA family transcriptional regulator [Oscillospiraceae bacterium]